MTPAAIISQAQEAIRSSAAAPPLIHPGNFVRWYNRIGDRLFPCLAKVNWPAVNNPTAYVAAIVREEEARQALPDYEVKQSDCGVVVLLRDPQEPTKVLEILRGREATAYLQSRDDLPAAPGDGRTHSVPLPTGGVPSRG